MAIKNLKNDPRYTSGYFYLKDYLFTDNEVFDFNHANEDPKHPFPNQLQRKTMLVRKILYLESLLQRDINKYGRKLDPLERNAIETALDNYWNWARSYRIEITLHDLYPHSSQKNRVLNSDHYY